MAQIPNRFGDNDSKRPGTDQAPKTITLAQWVMAKVQYGREVRDTAHGVRWKEYTRIWRGFYTNKDKTTDSERSRLISPASAQAVEMTVSEMEEATFGKTAWFDIQDDIADEQKDDAIAYRDQLLEDFELANMKEAVADVYLLGAVYGTGILKINMEVKGREIMVKGEAIRPDEFVIDPAATSISKALYCAHEMTVPLQSVREKQARGTYKKGLVHAYSGAVTGDTDGTGNTSVDSREDSVLITEYYGKVPRSLLGGEGEAGMVEALVTIANESMVLKAVESPFTNKDRPVIAYQHDPVPGEFWGRGVVEKGYNPQKALDTELRARIDSLALTTAPMMGADITRLPKNPDMRTRPGKWLLTRGRPSEIIEPIAFNAPQLAATFQNAGDLERMVQMATGAMDSAIPIGQNRRNETMGGMGMQQAGFLKRSKRTMRRVERFLDSLVTQSLWRYMQFDPARYPEDMKFKVSGTMGMMAREVENQQLVQMLGFVPPESPAHGLIVQAIFENSSSADKDALKAAIQEMNRPPSEEEQQMQQQMQQLQLRMQTAEVEKEEALAQKAAAEAQLALAKTKHEMVLADLEDDKVELAAANAATGAEKTRLQREQIAVAREKNQIEEKKITAQKKSDS
jgi:hypothetical protein